MAGHSKFANIKHRKGAQDAKRAKLFTKLTREIMVAASIGQPDPHFNPRLRSALLMARKSGLPKDRIETAIKKGAGELLSDHYQEIEYEGYGPGGVAFIVEALTDNRNRTASDVRAAFTKSGGSLGESGSVQFMFNRIGLIVYSQSVTSYDAIFEAAFEAGAEDIIAHDAQYNIICNPNQLNTVRDHMQQAFEEAEEVELSYRAKDPVTLDEDQARDILKLIDALEDNDDVQHVYGNFEISNAILEHLSNE